MFRKLRFRQKIGFLTKKKIEYLQQHSQMIENGGGNLKEKGLEGEVGMTTAIDEIS